VALEAAVGAKLFTRDRNGVHLTDEGRAVESIARRAEEPLLALAHHLELAGASARGVVRLATSSILSGWLLACHLPAFVREHPDVQVEISVARRLIDLSRREVDVALRLRPPGHAVAEPSTVASKLAEVGFALYGRRGARTLIRYSGFEPGRAAVEALDFTNGSIRVDDIPTAMMLAKAGVGLVVLPCFMGDAEGSLLRASGVLERHRLYVATLPELRRAPRIDAVIRFLREVTKADAVALAGEHE